MLGTAVTRASNMRNSLSKSVPPVEEAAVVVQSDCTRIAQRIASCISAVP
jgi:hypothetical protein